MADEIGIHDDGVLTAVRGTIFMAKAETIITSALLKQFTVEAATVGVGDGMWTNLGHMSNDNLPEFALDGGDATTLSTWLKAAFRTQYAQTTGTVTFNSVQGDKGTFKTLYNAVDMTGAGVAFSLEKTPSTSPCSSCGPTRTRPAVPACCCRTRTSRSPVCLLFPRIRSWSSPLRRTSRHPARFRMTRTASSRPSPTSRRPTSRSDPSLPCRVSYPRGKEPPLSTDRAFQNHSFPRIGADDGREH